MATNSYLLHPACENTQPNDTERCGSTQHSHKGALKDLEDPSVLLLPIRRAGCNLGLALSVTDNLQHIASERLTLYIERSSKDLGLLGKQQFESNGDGVFRVDHLVVVARPGLHKLNAMLSDGNKN